MSAGVTEHVASARPQSDARRQLGILAVVVVAYALLVFVAYQWLPQQITLSDQPMPADLARIPRVLLALASAAIVLVIYGLAGLVGYGLARALKLPGVYKPAAGWREWLLRPLAYGLAVGVALVVLDRIFAAMGSQLGTAHPQFPMSLVASATAGIGEEILFRGFILGLWAFLLNLGLRRLGATPVALWTGNAVAAIAFAAGHLPAAMWLLGVSSPAALPPLLLAEGFLLNGLLGMVAGERYLKVGLVGAIGVHFWADVVWHVIWPLLGGM